MWTALIPFKSDGPVKTRLSGCLSLAERRYAADAMVRRLPRILDDTGRIGRTVMVSQCRPSFWSECWIRDPGHGLNVALCTGRRAIGTPLIVLLGDLPLIAARDVLALIAAAEANGIAIAPDRHGTGTNAIALRGDRDFCFRFGEDSFAPHLREAEERGRLPSIVASDGLALDCDRPEDFALAIRRGALFLGEFDHCDEASIDASTV